MGQELRPGEHLVRHDESSHGVSQQVQGMPELAVPGAQGADHGAGQHDRERHEARHGEQHRDARTGELPGVTRGRRSGEQGAAGDQQADVQPDHDRQHHAVRGVRAQQAVHTAAPLQRARAAGEHELQEQQLPGDQPREPAERQQERRTRPVRWRGVVGGERPGP